MTRHITARVGRALIAHALSDKYPTRSLEYGLAWLMWVWSLRVALPGNVMTGQVFQYFLVIAPEWCWGVAGVALSSHRIFALIRNGSWQPGPRARAAGAALGFNFWFALGALYTMAVWNGANDFPFRFCFGVLAGLEIFCFARCYQEYVLTKIKAGASGATVPGNGR